jgi:hypothetical protein
MAMPRPISRPALLLMSESARCPRITAAKAENGQKKNTAPQIKLAKALPLFCGGPFHSG